MSNHHLPYSDSDTEFLERQQALSTNPTYQLNEIPRAAIERYADPSPEIPLMELVIGIPVLVITALLLFAGDFVRFSWSRRVSVGRFIEDWFLVITTVVCLTAGVVAVTIGMVR